MKLRVVCLEYSGSDFGFTFELWRPFPLFHYAPAYSFLVIQLNLGLLWEPVEDIGVAKSDGGHHGVR